jgi:hypothetical protein
MSMFGYGYNLNTELLAALTELGGGCFGYIPDCSMISTIFINFLSSVLSSYTPKLQASITSQHKVVEFNAVDYKDQEKANLGTIQFGVTRNLTIKFKGVPEGDNIAEVALYIVEGERGKVVKISSKMEEDHDHVKVQRMRGEHIKMLEIVLPIAISDLKKA